MPGGDSDKGLGANKNEIYLSLENSTQYIDWWHEPVPGEDFDHAGSLVTTVFRPGVIYGISNKLNLYLTTALGVRSMNWFGDNVSMHHRDEHTAEDFDNAIGGILGDSKIIFRYLLKNTGAGDGYRIIAGSGLTIPSKNTLTTNPFPKTDEAVVPHRHFSMSDGTFNYNLDFQVFYKRSANPVFFGGSISIEKPIVENEYSYLPPTSAKSVLSVIYKTFDRLDSSVDLSLSLQSVSHAYWDNEQISNSDAIIMTPSFGYLFNVKKGAISIGIQKPYFLSGGFGWNDGEIEETTKAWQIIVAYRSMAKQIKF